MCRSDGLIGLSSTRTSASPGAKGGVGISMSFNTLVGSPVSRKINAFIHTSWVFASWVFRRRLNRGRMFLRLREQQSELVMMKPTKHQTEVSNAYWSRYAVTA